MDDAKSNHPPENGDFIPSVVSEREFYALSRTAGGYTLVLEKGLSVSDFRESAQALPDGLTLVDIEFVSEGRGAMEFIALAFASASVESSAEG